MNLNELKSKFKELYGEGEIRVFEAAGRVNLIGEHIDYNGGLVLPAALTLKSVVLARKTSGNTINLRATTVEGGVSLEIDKLENYKNIPWGSYQAGVAYIMQQRGLEIVPCDMLFHCDVPFGSGLSSSAAIEVSCALALMELGGHDYSLVDLAIIGQEAENKYTGVNCGIMDQFASSLGKEKNAIMLNCANLDYSYVPLDFEDYCLVIANTNKPRSLRVSKYNERREECEEGLRILKKHIDIDNLAALTPEKFLELKKHLPETIAKRVEHVVFECARVKESAEVLAARDNVKFGKLLDASHDSLKELYEVTGKELDAIVFAARKQKGVLGARMTGAGFGGCAIALVKRANTDAFIKNVGKEYTKETGLDAIFYIADISGGAKVY